MSEVIERAKKWLEPTFFHQPVPIVANIIQDLITELEKTTVECERLKQRHKETFNDQSAIIGKQLRRIAELEKTSDQRRLSWRVKTADLVML